MSDAKSLSARGASTTAPVLLVATPFIWEAGPHKGKPTVFHALRGFQRAGWDVHVLCATNRRGIVESSVDGVTVHYFRIPLDRVDFVYDAEHSYLSRVRGEDRAIVRHLKFRLWWLQFVVLGIVRAEGLARQLRPAATYGVNNPGIPIAAWIGRRRGIPSFGRIMGSVFVQHVRGILATGSDTPGVGTTAPASNRVRRALAWTKLWLARFDELLAFRLPTGAVIVTDDGTIDAAEITAWLGVPAARLRLWRNGTDAAWVASAPDRPAARAALGIPTDAPVLVWVSQLVDIKRADRLIDALPAVAAAVPDVVALIVGDGPARPALERRAAALGVAGRIRFAGFVARDALPTYLRAADAFVALYDYSNLSNTLLEALVAGLPVVTLANGRTGDVVTDGRNGLLLPPDVADPIAPALIRILSDDALRAELAAGASRYAASSLVSWDERIDREVAAVTAIVAEWRNHRP
ncbi:MAG: glycosyltransferase family 4 protein [Ardenticatenales bacterium]|nr:glycosyltransferase family 4 protein [Ardenticatenales bacterium]